MEIAYAIRDFTDTVLMGIGQAVLLAMLAGLVITMLRSRGL